MRPGVPHFVIGPEDAICYGGHFYATSHMHTTLQSLVHSFVVSDFITNITHHPSRSLLRRIVLLYYIGLVEERFQSTGKVGFLFLPHVSDSIHKMSNTLMCQISTRSMVCSTCYQPAFWPSSETSWIFVPTALRTKEKTFQCLPLNKPCL